MSSNLAIAITVGASVGTAIAGLKNLRSVLGLIRNDAVSTGKKLSILGAGTTVAAVGTVNSLKMVSGIVMGLAEEAVKFEAAMADVKKVVDFESPEGLQNLQKDILQMTRTIPMTKEELAKIAASGGQLGVAEKDLKSFTATIAKMGVAFDMSAEQAGDSMAKLANVYQIPIAQIGKLGDAVNHLSNSSPAKAADIINTLGRVGGVAKQFGLTELQTASLSNAFISLGRTPEVAGTAINGMLTKLMTADKQGKKFQAVLEGMGTDAKTLKKAIAENGEQALVDFLKQIEKLPKESRMGALVDLFGLEYADDVAVLAGGMEAYEKSIKALQKAGKDGMPEFTGSMEREFAARSATTENGLILMKSGFAELKTVIGGRLLPIINKAAAAIAAFMHNMADFAARNPELTDGLLMVGGVVAALIIGFSAFTAIMGVFSMGWVVAAKPIMAVSAALRSFGFAVRVGLPLLRAFGHGLFAGFGGLFKVLAVLTRFSAVGLFQGLLTVFRLLSGGIMQLIRFLPMLGQAFLMLGRFLLMTPIGLALGLLAAAAYLLYTRWADVVGGAKLLWQDLCTFFSGLWQQITAFFNSGIGNIAATILNFSPLGLFYQSFAAVLNWFGISLPAQFTGFGSMIIDGLVSGIKAKIDAAVAAVQNFGARLKSTFAGVMQIHSPSRVFAGYGGYMTEGLAIGINRGAARPLRAVGAWAGSLKDGFARRVGGMRADLAARISGDSADFAAARAAQSQAQAGGITVNFNPTINAPGGDHAQIQTALQMGLREFEALFNRMMADRERRAY